MPIQLCGEIDGREAIEDAFPCPCGLPTCRARVPARPAPVPLREEAGTFAIELRPDDWRAYALFVTRYADGGEWWSAEDSAGSLAWEGPARPDGLTLIEALADREYGGRL
jgi:hypothetical protein